MNYRQLLGYINIVAEAHQEKENKHGKVLRKLPSGEENPYFLHPLWCSIMILSEPNLQKDIRENGAIALLFHDILEDTTIDLPPEIPEIVKKLILDMTVPKLPEYNYSSWALEKHTILYKPVELQLLKLYDKTASLYDLVLDKNRYKEWMDIIEKLAENVEEHYGRLNIVVLAKSLVENRRKSLGII